MAETTESSQSATADKPKGSHVGQAQYAPRPIWSHVWPFITAQWRDTAWGLALTLLGIGASLLQPWLMQIIVDSILTKAAVALAAVCGLSLACNFLRGGC